MDSITFKNFRQFKDETTFDLRNINILVGKNNSGKSTLTKGLRLYLFNIKNLKFAFSDNIFSYRPFFLFGGDALDNPHIGTFGRALSQNADDDFMSFSVRLEHLIIETKVSRYSVHSKDKDGNLIDFYDKTSAPLTQIVIFNRDLDARFTFDFEKEHQLIEFNINGKGQYYKKWETEIREIEKNPDRCRCLKNGKKFYSVSSDEKRVDTLKHCIAFASMESVKMRYKLWPSHFTGNLYSVLCDGALQNLWDISIEQEDFKTKSPKLYKTLSNDNFHDYYVREILIQTSNDINNAIYNNAIVNIEAHSVTRSLVYNVSDKNDYMAQTILGYMNENINTDDPEKEFIENWMMKFDIGEDFEIESIGGECYKLGIFEDVDHPESITPLLDKGVGSNQIMILLLQLATIMHKNRGATIPPLVIIEEPEQNLHPKLQSCLADLFREVYLYPQKENKNSRGISFVIETHSEYLVRKSQILVAKRKQTEANPFTVFYMEKGKEPREIRYQDSGVFYDDFGEGFYDEAISLTEEIV